MSSNAKRVSVARTGANQITNSASEPARTTGNLMDNKELRKVITFLHLTGHQAF
jgi:hypothetical protein